MNYTLIKKIHRTVALVSSLFFLMAALSGIILNHSNSGYRPALAGDPPQSTVLSASQPGGQWPDGQAPAGNKTLAFAGGVEAAGHAAPGGTAQEYYARARYGPPGNGSAWSGGGNPGGDVPAAGAYVRNPWKSLHTGRFLGLSSLVCDLTALALIVTVLTGLYLYFYGLRRKNC